MTDRVSLETLKDGFELATEPVLNELAYIRFGFEVGIDKGVVFKDL